MNERYIVTIEQLASIVKYCVRMTIVGSDHIKHWKPNVEEAIGLNGTRTVMSMDKIILEKWDK